MSIIVKYDEFWKENVTAGLHQAECLFVEDIGLQEVKFNDNSKTVHQIVIGWEILDERKSNGEAFIITKRYTLSFYPTSTLRKTIENWFAKKFDKEEVSKGIEISKIIGKQCMLNISLSDKNYPIINSVSPLPKNVSKTTKTVVEIPEYIASYTNRLKEQCVTDKITNHVSSDNKYKEAYSAQSSHYDNIAKITTSKDEDLPF